MSRFVFEVDGVGARTVSEESEAYLAERILKQLVATNGHDQVDVEIEQNSGVMTHPLSAPLLILLSLFIMFSATMALGWGLTPAPLLAETAFYSWFIDAFGPETGVAFNGLAFLLVVYLTARVSVAAMDFKINVAVLSAAVVLAAGLGALPFIVALATPDIFVSVIILSIACLCVFASVMSFGERTVLAGLVGFGHVVVPESLPLLLCFLPVSVIVAFKLRRPGWTIGPKILTAVVAFAILDRFTLGLGTVTLTDMPGADFWPELASNPYGMTSDILRSALAQANRFDVREFLDGVAHDSGWIAAVSGFHTLAYAISALLAIVLTVLPQKAPPLEIRALAGLMLVGIMVNAAVSSQLFGGSDLQGARVAFLLPMGLAMLLMFHAPNLDADDA